MKHLFPQLIKYVSMVAMAVAASATLPVLAADTDPIPPQVMFSYAGAPYRWGATNVDSYKGGAMHLTKDIVARFDQCSITEIEIANGLFYDVEEAPITIFFTNGLTEKPFYSFQNFMDIDSPWEYKAYKLTEPVEITAGSPFFVGFTAHAPSPVTTTSKCNAPVLTDGAKHTDLPGGYIGFSTQTGTPEEMKWEDEGYSGGQVCIRLKIEGDVMPLNTVELKAVNVSNYMTPDSTYLANVTVCNRGVNEISDLDVSYSVFGDTTTTHIQLYEPLEYEQTAFLPLPMSVREEGVNIPLYVSIDKVNGVMPSATAPTVKTAIVHSLSSDNGFFHNMVVEAAGGMGCGATVRGIVGLSRTFSVHSDGSFIPITALSSDENEDTAPFGYGQLWKRNITHVPSCLVNRNKFRYGISQDDWWTMAKLYDEITDTRAIAEVEITGYEMVEGWLSVDSDVRFAIRETDGEYSVAYVVTEDAVGPYIQYNDYSGWDGDMDGWENLPTKVSTYYDFVARGISEFYGTPLLQSGKIEPGVSYSHSDRVNLVKVSDMDKLALVAMVINDKTGCIENGCRIRLEGVNSIRGIANDTNDAPVEYYDLSGRRLTGKPSSGFYIRRQGDQAEKFLR